MAFKRSRFARPAFLWYKREDEIIVRSGAKPEERENKYMTISEKKTENFPWLIILASASPRRRDILKQLCIEPVIIPSDLEERVTSTKPDQVVMELSAQKAGHVAELCREKYRRDFVVIGADTVVAAEGKILGKPGDEEEARTMIRLLSGKVHQVYTGITLIQGDRKVTLAEKTDVAVASMTEEEIEEYVSCGESMDKAGAYGIQGRFAAFIEGINGSYTNVMGLPARRVYEELKRLLEEKND